VPIGLNEVIDRGVNTAIQRRLGLGALATLSLMPELATTLDIGPQPEIQYNLGWRLYQHNLSLAAVAAARAHSRFRVTSSPGTRVIVVLERLTLEGNGASNFAFVDLLGTSAADLTNPFPNHQARDFRQNNAGGSLTNGSQVILSTVVDGTAATLGVFWQGTVPPGTQAGYIDVPGIKDVCLTNGMGVQVDFAGLNQPAILTWQWRERIINDQEAAA
jgi:hypothetical protein